MIMLRYLSILLIAVFIAIFYKILILARVKRVKKQIETEKEKEDILNFAIKLERLVDSKRKAGELEEYKKIDQYLSQCTCLIEAGSVDNVRVGQMKNDIEKDEFLDELKRLPDSLLGLVAKQCSINRSTWEIKNPFSAKIHDAKIKVLFFVLRLSLAVLKYMENQSTEKIRESQISVEVKNSGILRIA